MSITVTEQGVKYIKDNLFKHLQIFEIAESEIEQEIVYPLVESIQADRRLVMVSYEEVAALAFRFKREVPNLTKNTQIRLGKVLIEYRDGVYYREYVDANSVLKGWHKEVVDLIKSRKKIPFNRQIGEIIFKVGQVVIANTSHLYLDTAIAA